MGDAGDRMDRAGRYVLGLMDEAERERAERDLEVDPVFREAMVAVAERMHVFDKRPGGKEEQEEAPDPWRQIKDRLDSLPQMRSVEEMAYRPATDPFPLPHGDKREATDRPAAFGRRKKDWARVPLTMPKPEVTRPGLHSMPGRTALVLAIALIGAFALGYVAGVSSTRQFPAELSP